MIKILSLCAALLAPESTGLDPHGRSLHLKLYEDFNISYDACIATAKQARKYGIDPFVATALMYKETKFSPKLAKKSKLFRKIRKIHGCEPGSNRFIKSSCSAFMVFAPHLATMLEKNYIDSRIGTNYRKALRDFFGRSGKRKAKIIENVAKRYADVYSRTHTSFAWNSPFKKPESAYPEESYITKRRQRRSNSHINDPYLSALINDLDRVMPYDYKNRQLQQKMEYDLQLLYKILGAGCRIEAKSRNFDDPEYFLYINRRDLRESLYMAASLTSSQYKPHTFQEYSDGKLVLLLNAPKRALIFIPHSENTYVVTIK
tara:strand:+ start:109 stop:1059 length:951 start_codon:yes stop_codon:yes gene_type:complete